MAGTLVALGFFGTFFLAVIVGIAHSRSKSSRKTEYLDPHDLYSEGGMGLSLSLRNKHHRQSTAMRSTIDG